MNEKENQSFQLSFKFTVVLTLIFGVALLAVPLGHTKQKSKPHDMPGMDMHDEDMSDMGPSMAAMAGHMYMTPLRPKQPGDKEKAITVVATAKAAIERYNDYRKALADGYVIANPKLKQPQYHFMNQANTREADLHFDPSKPTALLYRRTPMQEYKLEGVMFTASPDTTEDELNERVPLSIARWHRHVNVCWAPADRIEPHFSVRTRLQRCFFHERRCAPRALIRANWNPSQFLKEDNSQQAALATDESLRCCARFRHEGRRGRDRGRGGKWWRSGLRLTRR